VRDQNFLLLFNAHHEAIPFKLPAYAGARWHALLDTGFEDGLSMDGTFDAGAEYALQGRSLALLRQVKV
jgi:glycogen operon protein